jgi:pimeloyl-ACP methyl ester carboxylesterase
MPKIHIGDIELYYEIHGDGEPLVLIPGFRTGLWLWFKQVEVFAQRFRAIVFDPRGIGESDKPDVPMTIKTLADDLAALLSALNIENAHILGVSFGGFVAQEFAINYPQMTRSLILCCTSFGGPRHLLPSLATLQAMSEVAGLNTDERTRRNFQQAFSPKFVSERSVDLEQAIGLRLQHAVSDQTHFAQLQAAATFDAEARVSRIKAPTLVLTGDEDTLLPSANSHNLVAAIPLAQLKIIEGGSHMFFIEQPEIFNQTVIEFIDGVISLESGIESLESKEKAIQLV